MRGLAFLSTRATTGQASPAPCQTRGDEFSQVAPPSPLPAQLRNGLEQGALGRGAVGASVARQLRFTQFRAALGQSFAERREVDPASGPFRISLGAFRYHNRQRSRHGYGDPDTPNRAAGEGHTALWLAQAGPAPCPTHIAPSGRRSDPRRK